MTRSDPGDLEEYVSESEAETAAVGRRLAGSCGPGTVVLLEGELGAGKTAFVRGLAEGVGADPEAVTSPTFTLLQEYPGQLPLYHADLYRLEAPEIIDLGIEEWGADGVLAVEWGDKLPGGLPGAIYVRIAHEGEETRRITIGRYSSR